MPLAPKYRRALGDNIRAHRKRAGFSQEKLAEKADLRPVYISAVERGVKTISVDGLWRIAQAVGTDIKDLFEGV
jgi:transcriptional regulator with XRE-family HTH domain